MLTSLGKVCPIDLNRIYCLSLIVRNNWRVIHLFCRCPMKTWRDFVLWQFSTERRSRTSCVTRNATCSNLTTLSQSTNWATLSCKNWSRESSGIRAVLKIRSDLSQRIHFHKHIHYNPAEPFQARKPSPKKVLFHAWIISASLSDISRQPSCQLYPTEGHCIHYIMSKSLESLLKLFKCQYKYVYN